DLHLAIRRGDVAELEAIAGFPLMALGGEPGVTGLLGKPDQLLDLRVSRRDVVWVMGGPHRCAQDVGQPPRVPDSLRHLDRTMRERAAFSRISREELQSEKVAHDPCSQGAVPLVERGERLAEEQDRTLVPHPRDEAHAVPRAAEGGTGQELWGAQPLGELGGLLQTVARRPVRARAPARLAELEQELAVEPLVARLLQLERLECSFVVIRRILVGELPGGAVAGPPRVVDRLLDVPAAHPLEEMVRELGEMWVR